MITVTRAPAYLTVQDIGRPHSRAIGVPPGGAMDSFALQATNALVGNRPHDAVLEWALGGGSIRFDRDCAFCLGGAESRATLSGRGIGPWSTVHARSGDELSIERITTGRFLYIAVSGGINVPPLLSSRSTYLPGHFGGHEGGLVRTGASLALGPQPDSIPPEGFHFPAGLLPHYGSGTARLMAGPQADLFAAATFAELTGSEYRISTASDRTGYKLDGPPLVNSAPTLPSEASCPGAIQVPADGKPIVLMSDAPTVGGYPKIAVVADTDLPIVAQLAPGDSVHFELVEIAQSQRALERRASDLHTIGELARRADRAIPPARPMHL